ncbi:MAG: glucosaminidase domain-containing protein [Actinomycetota bacterium]
MLVAGVLSLGVLTTACVVPPPPDVCDAPASSTASAVAVMGSCPRLTFDEMVAWFDAVASKPTYRASVPIRDLVTYYVEEGRAEGVRGDIAFAQSIIETGYFSSYIAQTKNNFAGIGAANTDPIGGAATFPDARSGVRAQIQHLRAYADATATTCAQPPLHNPCIDPRFNLVSPKGKAPTWNQFGNGVWATDPYYSFKIVGRTGDVYKGVYTRMLEKYGLTLA